MALNNSALSPASLIAQAFKCDDLVSSKTTMGVQTMAAAIFAAHSERESRRPEFSKYAEKGQSFLDFKAEIVDSHILKRMKKSEGKADVVVSNNAKNAAQMIMLSKGFDLAFALSACGVSNASFVTNKDGGMFHVPVSSLIANDDNALGALAVAQKKEQLVPLDGRTYAYESDGKFSNLKAYPARVIECAGYKKPKKAGTTPTPAATNGASDTTANGGADAETLRLTPSAWSNEKVASDAVNMLNLLIKNLKVDSMPALSDLDPRLANALTEIKALFDDAYHAELTKVDADSEKRTGTNG